MFFKITKDHLPVIKFEDNFNIQQCISKSKAAVVNVIVESIEVNNPEHELKQYYININKNEQKFKAILKNKNTTLYLNLN